MADFVNDRDVLIMATVPRFAPPTDRAMIVTPSAAIFKVAGNGTGSPGSITFRATLLNMTGSVAWSWPAGEFTPIVDGNELTIPYGAMAALSSTVTATLTVDGVQYTQVATVAKVADGTQGIDGVRGNINISAPTGAVVWSDSEAVAAIAAFGYGTPRKLDAVTLFNNAAGFAKTKLWDGDSWENVAQVIDGNQLVRGTVYAEALATEAITASSIRVSGNGDNLIPDPKFRDLAWWRRVGHQVNDEAGANSPWKGGATLILGPTGGAEVNSDSMLFPMTPGATYHVEFQIALSGDFGGVASVFWYQPFQAFDSMGAPTVGNWESDGLPVQFNHTTPRNGVLTFSKTVTLNEDSRVSVGMIRIRNAITTGYMQLASLSITRVSDGVLIKDDAVTARKIKVNSLEALSATIGLLRTSATGARTEIADNVIKMYAANNVKVLHLGDSSL
ncbi:hypothetical protein [Massilia sp. METH4]|uniref:hypothetical protein n=1 Tax=Massilia sp. METH4 TaxID=3123041 RepID=UPI0030D62879